MFLSSYKHCHIVILSYCHIVKIIFNFKTNYERYSTFRKLQAVGVYSKWDSTSSQDQQRRTWVSNRESAQPLPPRGLLHEEELIICGFLLVLYRKFEIITIILKKNKKKDTTCWKSQYICRNKTFIQISNMNLFSANKWWWRLLMTWQLWDAPLCA